MPPGTAMSMPPPSHLLHLVEAMLEIESRPIRSPGYEMRRWLGFSSIQCVGVEAGRASAAADNMGRFQSACDLLGRGVAGLGAGYG
jgi:hypothetical protein